MRPTLHPRLLNGRTGDPGVYLEALHLPGAVLLDCGDLSALSPRHLLRVDALAVSHAHMDHWGGFDRLLRLLIGREKRLPVVGPAGFAERLFHRLQAYTWNLADRIPADLAFEVTEVAAGAAAWPACARGATCLRADPARGAAARAPVARRLGRALVRRRRHGGAPGGRRHRVPPRSPPRRGEPRGRHGLRPDRARGGGSTAAR